MHTHIQTLRVRVAIMIVVVVSIVVSSINWIKCGLGSVDGRCKEKKRMTRKLEWLVLNEWKDMFSIEYTHTQIYKNAPHRIASQVVETRDASKMGE